MVMNELKNKLKNIINKYGINSKEAYNQSLKIAFELENSYKRKNAITSYYNESMCALEKYIKKNEANPNEKTWNIFAKENKYLSAETLGYLYGKGFNKLCKDIRKEMKNAKKSDY
jgi:hypothetical protein